ncbi:MAG TPA: PEP-CTERM sorting domain-containing protein [Acidobacteriaceae bacterium]|jgi:hypothetical protein
MRSVFSRFLCLLFLGAPLVAHADTTYDFTAIGADFTSSGSFTVGIESPYTSGAYEITSITGTLNGVAISLMPGSYDASNPTYNTGDPTDFNFYFDNLFYPSAPNLDGNGIGIDVGTSGYEVNFYYGTFADATVPSYIFFSNADNFTEPMTFTVTPAVPEPSSLLLLGTGVLGAAGALRRRLV